MPEEVRLAVEEAEQAAYITIDCSWRLFGKLLQENGYVLDSNRLVGTVRVEYLPSQIPNDVVGNLGALSLHNKPHKLSQVCGQVLLVVKQLNDLRVVVALEELDFASILLHTKLQHVEKHLFEVRHFNVRLVVLQKVEACFEEALYKAFIDLLLRPEQMNVLLKQLTVHRFEGPLACAGNRIQLLLPPILLVSSVLLGDAFSAFGQICLLEVFQLTEVGKEPCNKVDVGGERILHLNGQFALWILAH